MLKKFKKNELFYNKIETNPYVKFFVFDRKVYYNNKSSGSVSLYELNVERPTGQEIYPFITKDGSLTAFRTVSSTDYNDNFAYGDTLTGSYPLTSSISSDYHTASVSDSKSVMKALKNTLNYYKPVSNHYSYSSSLGDKGTQKLRLISIPSIFYGSSIKKGTLDLKFYITGTLIAQAQDLRKNGELIQTNPIGSNGSGSIAGVVLYNEGFIVLTGAWDVSNGNHTEEYIPGGAAIQPEWVHFGTTGSDDPGANIPQSSFEINFQGTNYVPTISMLCNAGRGELNYSNNPSFLKKTQTSGSITALTSSNSYKEYEKLEIKNIVKSPWGNHTSSFEPTTYISKIGIYDENKNLIAIAKLNRPLRKRLEDSYNIKLKLDF